MMKHNFREVELSDHYHSLALKTLLSLILFIELIFFGE